MRGITLIWLVLVAAVSSARADSAADATKLFSDAVALKDAGKHAEACSKFEQSFELDKQAGRPAPGTQLNLGECAERDNQIRKAYLLFDDAEQEYGRRAKAAEGALAKDPSSADAKRDLERAQAGQKLARQRADVLAPRLAKIVVRIAEPAVAGLAIRIGDRTLAADAEVIDYVDTGSVTITATATDRQPFTTTANAEAGKSVVVDIPVLQRIGGAGPEPGAPGGRRQRKRLHIAAVVGGTGVALFGASVIVALGAKSDYNEATKTCTSVDGKQVCPPDVDRNAIDRSFSKADTATIIGIGGLACIAAGAVIFFTAPRESLAVTPMASSSTAGLSVSGRF